ncbi:MAG: pyrroline-5-carboxylate reductase [Myxococcota bacterium]|nr:pyrroline-5-carboxylate reductase [Myxococcota bacterium]
MGFGKLGFIGCGRLGQALLRGWLDAGVVQPERVFIATKSSAKRTAQMFGVQASSPQAVFDRCDVVILAMKPHQLADALADVECPADRLVVSTMAGVPIQFIRDEIPGAQVVRTMPNVACRIARGVTLSYAGPEVADEARIAVESLFGHVGLVERLAEEAYFHAGTGVSGSGPAYVFMAVQAMADGGVAAGMSRDAALRLSIATVEGAAALLRTTGEHPEALKDSVASPNGTTVAGLRVLERRGMRGALCDAVVAAAERSHMMASEAGKS